MLALGITGPPASGKDRAAIYLSERYGFQHVSTGDLLRQEARRRNLDEERHTLQALGHSIRQEHGYDPLFREALNSMQIDTVFTGIRTIDAAETLVASDHQSSLIYIDAPLTVRYERSVKRQRGGETLGSFATFQAMDEIEHNGTIEKNMSLNTLKEMAHFAIFNCGDIELFYRDIKNVIMNVRNNEDQPPD